MHGWWRTWNVRDSTDDAFGIWTSKKEWLTSDLAVTYHGCTLQEAHTCFGMCAVFAQDHPITQFFRQGPTPILLLYCSQNQLVPERKNLCGNVIAWREKAEPGTLRNRIIKDSVWPHAGKILWRFGPSTGSIILEISHMYFVFPPNKKLR